MIRGFQYLSDMEMTLPLFLALCLGGGIGSMGRAALAGWIGRKGAAILAIYLINLTGSFLIGLGYGLHRAAPLLSDPRLAFFAIGLLGGYTTVSTHALQVLNLWQDGQPRAALILALGAPLTCPLAAWAGLRAAMLGA